MPNAVRMNSDYPVISASDALYQRALGLVPAATQMLEKGPGQWTKGVAPKYLARGRGARVWDVDGNEYVDLAMAIGPVSLGYAHPAVDAAIREQLESGVTFSLMHPLEVEVAELVRDVVPSADLVRFSKTGCDVTTAAVRVARAFTRRERVLCCGYHGWHDWYIAVTDRNRGVPRAVADLTRTVTYNDFESIEQSIDRDTACVILEPTVFEPPAPGWLEHLRELCTRRGVVLIFDETWTGFRMGLGGAQEAYGVRADLSVFSNAVANGMPLSILTGRADVMKLLDEQVFFFSTFGGEALSLAAAKATILHMHTTGALETLARQGRKLRKGYGTIARELGLGWTHAIGHDWRSLITFDPRAGNPLEVKALLQQEMIKRGVLWSGFHNASAAHTDEDVAHVLAAYREALPLVADAVREGKVRQALRGEPLVPMFRKTSQLDPKPASAPTALSDAPS